MLDAAEVFTSFKLLVTADDAPLLTPGRHFDFGFVDSDGSNVWVDPAWLCAMAPQSENWTNGFSTMLTYARKNGWLDASGSIRAHIELVYEGNA